MSFEQSHYSVSENDDVAQLVLVLSNTSLSSFTVYIANPRDGRCIQIYTQSNNNYNIFTEMTEMYNVTFYPGEITAPFIVQIVDDNLIESDEILQFIILSNLLPDGVGSDAPNEATLIIIDDAGKPGMIEFVYV